MKIDRKSLAAHALRLADAAIFIQAVAQGQRVQHAPPVAPGILPAAGEQPLHVVLAHRAGWQRHARREALALEATAGDRHMHVLDSDAGHAFGRVDGRADASLGAVEMGDHAGLKAFGARVIEAEHLELNGIALALEPIGNRRGLGDQAADLARADVERGDDALAFASYGGCVTHPPALKPTLTSCPWPARPWCSPSEYRSRSLRWADWRMQSRASAR